MQNPAIMVSFEQVGCIRFCEKIQGYILQVAKQFSLRFNGIEAKVGNMQFQVFEDSIDVAIEIHARGEKWFKGM
jgi:hypothetical protein